MSDFGVTPEGFNPKLTGDILDDIQTAQTQAIDPNLDLQPTNPLGVMNGIVAGAVAETWQLGAVLYDGMDRDNATDDQLTSLCLLTGTQREGAQDTQVVGCIVNVDGGFDALPGTMFAQVQGVTPAAIFTNKEEVSNTGGSPANVTVDFVAINPGPQQVLAGTLTQINQALTGWNSITNPSDGIIGNNGEVDTDLRARTSEDLSSAGASTADAVKKSILDASQAGEFSSLVKSCVVLFNDSDGVDANGLPGHSIEVICYQPGNTSDDDQKLADIIAESKGGGIGTWGQSTKTHTDSQGFNETIRFTRPSPLRSYIAITLTPAASGYAGDVAIQEALANYGNALGAGSVVVAQAVKAQAFGAGLGVFDVTSFTIDVVYPPVATGNITPTVRQVATFSTSDIAVTS